MTKTPWTSENREIGSYIGQFKAIAKLVGVREPRAKMTMFWTLLRGGVRAEFDGILGCYQSLDTDGV